MILTSPSAVDCAAATKREVGGDGNSSSSCCSASVKVLAYSIELFHPLGRYTGVKPHHLGVHTSEQCFKCKVSNGVFSYEKISLLAEPV